MSKPHSDQTGGDYVITFGRYIDYKLRDVPDDYLDWCVINITNNPYLIEQIRLYRKESGQ